ASFVYTELGSSGTRGRPRSTAARTESRSTSGDRGRRPGRPRWPGSAALREGATIAPTGPVGNQPRPPRGLYRQEARRWRKSPDHQRAASEPQRAGGVGGGAELTSPTSPKRPPRSSAPCAAWGVPPWASRLDG